MLSTYYPVTIASGKVRTQRPFYYMIVGLDEVTNCISKIKIWHFECKKEGGKLYFRLSDNLSRICFHFYVQKIFIILIFCSKYFNFRPRLDDWSRSEERRRREKWTTWVFKRKSFSIQKCLRKKERKKINYYCSLRLWCNCHRVLYNRRDSLHYLILGAFYKSYCYWKGYFWIMSKLNNLYL